MKLNELKVRCLKKVKFDDNTAMNSTSIDEFITDRKYAKYLNNIIGSINDGIKRLVIEEKIPYQAIQITIPSSGKSEITKGRGTAYDVDLTNVYLVKAILHEDSEGVLQKIDYMELLDKYVLGEKFYGGKIIVYYAPRLRELAENENGNLDLETLGLNDLAMGYLIYFVKCELYEDLEPDLAVKWRSYAESYKSAMTQELKLPTQRKVKQVVRLGR